MGNFVHVSIYGSVLFSEPSMSMAGTMPQGSYLHSCPYFKGVHYYGGVSL